MTLPPEGYRSSDRPRTAGGRPRPLDPYGPPSARLDVDPFPADDPLDYGELSVEMSLIRALLAVLADTGASVVFPADRCPSRVLLMVASGWRLAPAVAQVAEDFYDRRGPLFEMTATWKPPPLVWHHAWRPCPCAGVATIHRAGTPGCAAGNRGAAT